MSKNELSKQTAISLVGSGVKEKSFFRLFFRKLFPEKSAVDFPDNYIPTRFFKEHELSGPSLVVSAKNDKELRWLREKTNAEIFAVDVVDNHNIDAKHFVLQSVEDPLPFPDGFFKTVLMTEVLEHTVYDAKSLENIRRVLADDGTFIVTVPFYSDRHDLHNHIYSPKTFNLILKHTGFVIIDKIYRNTFFAIPNFVIALVAVILYPLFGKKSLEKVNGSIYHLQIATKNWKWPNVFWRLGIFQNIGILAMAKKSEITDSIKPQSAYYKNK